jgi:hypothetical protein
MTDSASNSATTPTVRQPGDLPTWFTVLIVLLCVGGGGGLVWWYFTTPPKVVTVAITAPPQRTGQQQGRGPQQRQEAPEWNNDVRPVTSGYNGRAGNVRLVARKLPDGQFELTVRYRTPLIPRPQLMLTRVPAFADSPAQSAQLKLTPEQIAALKQVPRQQGMLMSAEDTQQLRAAFDTFEKAPPDQRTAPKQKLLELLGALDAKNLEPTKAALIANVAAIRAILTAEQQQMIEANQITM